MSIRRFFRTTVVIAVVAAMSFWLGRYTKETKYEASFPDPTQVAGGMPSQVRARRIREPSREGHARIAAAHRYTARLDQTSPLLF